MKSEDVAECTVAEDTSHDFSRHSIDFLVKCVKDLFFVVNENLQHFVQNQTTHLLLWWQT